MPEKKKVVTPRINLAKALDSSSIPSAGSVAVTFDYNGSPNKVAIVDGDISVDKAKMQMLFDLSSSNVPFGTTVEFEGIEFAKPNEPSGNYAPGGVFENESTFTDQNGDTHTVYGSGSGDSGVLHLVDDDNVGPSGTEEDYGYRVWVKVTEGSSTNYYSSPDPQVKNKPTSG